ncbi:phosphodiester glycosidase family protein [Niabella aurantiaca]|uniref:phosphodiester glycosidase family protein n=1 Tax=Niabella aurantiaca TaxID=379900 RepID=UPI000365031A|nr:phosphodiester glycosidase family protein [Niabella aurantiaca]
MRAFRFYRLLPVFLVLFACNKDYVPSTTAEEGGKGTSRIDAVSKLSGNAGDTLVLNGTFGNSDVIMFGSLGVEPFSRSSSELKFVVPGGTGSSYISVKTGGIESNKWVFSYLLPPPPQGYKIGAVYYDIDTTALYAAGPGTKYLKLDFRDQAGESPIRVHLMVIDVANPYVQFRSVLAMDSVLNVETVPAMAGRKSAAGQNYFAGINGDRFNNDANNANFGRVSGACVVDGTITNSNSSIQSYAPVYFNQNTIYFDDIRLNTSLTLANGSSMSFRTINNSRAADDLVLYNVYRGVNSATNIFGTELAVVPADGSWGDHQDVPVKVLTKTTEADKKGSTIIPAGGAVLSAHGTQSASFLTEAGVGDVLKVTANISNDRGVIAEQLISGDFRILKDGAAINGDGTRSGRTAIGATQDKSKIIFCVVEGAIEGVSVGASRADLADILKIAGAYNAVNLNGGDLSTLYLKNSGYNHTGLMNQPGGTTAAPNAGNGLFVVSTAPADAVVSRLVSDVYSIRLQKGETVTPNFYGLNQYDHIADPAPAGVTLSGAPGLGIIEGASFKAGETAGHGVLTASYNGLTTTIHLNVVD